MFLVATPQTKGASLAQEGIVALQTKQYEKAVQIFTRYLNWYGPRGALYSDRGDAYSGLGESDKAIEDFKMAVRLNPTFYVCFYNRGNEYCNMGLYDKSISDLDEAIRLKPHFGMAYAARGEAYFYEKKLSRAEEDFKLAVE